jgi:hypothetical protein
MFGTSAYCGGGGGGAFASLLPRAGLFELDIGALEVREGITGCGCGVGRSL